MANFTRIIFFTIAFALLAVLFVVHGNDTLRDDTKYIIYSVADDLVMTAGKGKYPEHIGIVYMEQFEDLPNQKWLHQYLNNRKASIFLTVRNDYNNVTTFHEKKGTFPLSKEFAVSANEDNVYTIKETGFLTLKDPKDPKCLQNMGKGNAVQLSPCESNFPNQQWRFHHIP